MNFYLIYFLIIIIFLYYQVTNCVKDFVYLSNSTKCQDVPEDTSFGVCLRPLLNLWETVRSYEYHTTDISIPVPFFSTESIVLLCRLYTKSKEKCFTKDIYSNTCSSILLKKFLSSNLNYFCGNSQGIKFWQEFDCLRNIFIDKTKNYEVQECFSYIRESTYTSDEKRCNNIRYFLKCIGRYIKTKCGIHTLKLLTNAINEFGCFKTTKNVFKRISTNSIKLSKKYIDMCDEVKQKKLVQCYTPLMMRWDQIEREKFYNNTIGEKYHFFPLLKYKLEEIGELCDILSVIIEECLTTSVIQDCLSNENLLFIDQELGQACTYFNKEVFNLDYICMKEVILRKPECYYMIRGRNLPGLSPLIKCKKQTSFYECIHDDIKGTCGDKGLRILDDTIFNYGCRHPKQGPSVSVSKDEIVNTVEDNKHLSLDVGYKIDNSLILTKYGESISKGKHFYYRISNDCTHYNLMKSRSCTFNIIKEWKIMVERKKNPITLSIFSLSSKEVLEMCDNYANIFLCTGLENIISCMDDGNVRFVRDNLAYPCSPLKITHFMRAFNCISSIINVNSKDCKRFIIGTTLPGDDQRKCKGIVQFYDCISSEIKNKCGENGKQQLWHYINEYGCL